MHPVEKIRCAESDSLDGSTIVLAVTGSIAAVRCVELARSLIRRGAKVVPVMSRAATGILHPEALHYATGHRAITEITGAVEHVEYCGVEGEADLLLIAPATANTIGKIACGIDDTPVTTFATTALGSGKPVLIAPAMHEAMYSHQAVLENIERLKGRGVFFVEPVFEEGKAKIAENRDILLECERLLGKRTLEGRRIIITGGATAERVDPIRILTSRASGRTGVELALEAYRRGAEVTLVHSKKQNLHRIKEVIVESAREMCEAVLEEVKDADLLISAAAISDFTVDAAPSKIKSDGIHMLTLKPAVKLLEEVRKQYSTLAIIGFKAETNVSREELIQRAGEIMKRYRLSAVVANDVGSGGMGEETNHIHIIQNNKIKTVEGGKERLARCIINTVEEILG
jgi:phosphopantothenoylcysteine decarboxylase/phosphopantothenate--cysteine ligase